ncbi:MAG: (E)-4-hydroxy-3-methylbut-2-enyl-diphosphate synthase [Bacteroidales bacterium]|nr:(E)-4-hydroxy-3-methylbut-2-enyl-diphosphate synthase [Bacteroidales bacterium]
MNPGELINIRRFPSHEVQIGNIPLGANHPIRLQSMTNTNTMDVQATINQSIRIINAGADYVRISAPSVQAAHNLKEIKTGLLKAGFNNPVIADIHFNADVALVAAKYVEKIRINPGNYIHSTAKNKIHFTGAETRAELDLALQRLIPLVEVCKDHGTAIRIGTNMGSLSARIVTQYGNTPEGMVMATFEFLELFRELDFHNLVVSLKASNPLVMVQAYEGMVEKMLENKMSYPLHIGITEAGEGENGRIKSSLGICTLLNKGIGDTLRVSLTEEPENEIPFAGKISSYYQNAFSKKTSPDQFQIQKLSITDKEIFFPYSKIRAVVVANDIEKTAKEDSATFQSVFTGKYSKNELKPDFYFTHDKSLAERNRDKNFILTLNYQTEKKLKNILPLVYPGESQPKGHEPEGNFLVQLDCSQEDESFRLTADGKPLAVVANIADYEDACNLKNLINVCHSKDIPIIVRMNYFKNDSDNIIIRTGMMLAGYLLEKRIQGLWMETDSAEVNTTEISFGFLQSAGLRITRTEFISCPTCARTSFELEKVLHEVKNHFSGIPGLKIAVMGCVVNGPGEMADADFGFVGTATGKLHLYKGKNPMIKNIEPSKATEELTRLLSQYGYI